MSSTTQQSATTLFRYRRRAPVLLLWLLLINTIGVSGLTWYALRGQLLEIDQSRRQAEQHALDTLVARVEHAIYQAVQDPFLLLRNIPNEGVTDEHMKTVQARFGYIDQILLLDRQTNLVKSWPAPLDPDEREWLIAEVNERIVKDATRGAAHDNDLHIFADYSAGIPQLYAFQSMGENNQLPAVTSTASRPGWVLVGCEISKFATSVLTPLLSEFESQQHVKLLLQSPDTAATANAVSAPLAHVLPGWRLEATPSVALVPWFLRRWQWAPIAASCGLMVAITLIGIAIYWELHREHALVELRNRFVANVSHELKTPLSLIRMYAETLYLNRLSDPDRQHEYQRVILAESERLSRMIGDILDFSRLRDGLPVYKLTHTDLRATVLGVLDTYGAEWREKGAVVRNEIAGELAPVAHDPQGITQIVLNLVDNAIKYCGDDKTVEVRLVTQQDRSCLDVVDFGPGMRGESHRRLWRSVQTGAVNDEARGSGLGLVLVRQICEAHHAHFVLNPTTGDTGLTASISFPNYRPSV